MVERERIEKALEWAHGLGGIDGEHHKAYVIDQMVRALTGCPEVSLTAIDYKGALYQFLAQGESQEYLEFVARAKQGEDGPETYEWDVGIAP